jgi:hypothetical protein
MRVTINRAEQQLIERALRLANMREIKSTKQVEDLFTDLPFVGVFDHKGRQVFQVLKPSEVEVYRETQSDLRKMLGSVASGRAKERAEVLDVLRRTQQPVLLIPSDTAPQQIFVFPGVEACWKYVLLLLLDPSRGLTNRLGRCDAPDCGNFNLAFTGRPKRYCNEKHRLAADALRVNERVKEWREWVKKHGRKKRELGPNG